MATKTFFQVALDGKPQRFVGVPSRGRVVDAGEGLDGPDEFTAESNANDKAKRFGLVGYAIIPAIRDIGTPSNLSEIGF